MNKLINKLLLLGVLLICITSLTIFTNNNFGEHGCQEKNPEKEYTELAKNLFRALEAYTNQNNTL